MADHHETPTRPKAKKEYRCVYCGGPILVGEQYVQHCRNRYHAECYETCADECSHYGEWKFSRYNGEYPERVKAVVDARWAALASQPPAPAWHDAPTVPGLWLDEGLQDCPNQFTASDIQQFQVDTGTRWFGPIPEDTK